jgi:3-oxoacyl-[acyl-carrier protein] reductase
MTGDGAVVITGSGQGLGRAFALAAGAAGYPVAVADLNADNAAAVAAEIDPTGGRAKPFQVDVGDESSVARLAKDVGSALGTVLGLVNNAAIFSALEMRPFENIGLATWDAVMRVNVTGTFLCCREFLPTMAAAGYGKIVNVSSATIFTGRPGYLHYVTSKAAIIGMTRSLASEVGPRGIRVNAITPGSTETEIPRATISRADRERMASQTPLRRVQVPDDLIGSVLFLLSPGSDFITGQTINVDGGYAFH